MEVTEKNLLKITGHRSANYSYMFQISVKMLKILIHNLMQISVLQVLGFTTLAAVWSLSKTHCGVMFLERRNKYSYLCPVIVFWPQEFAIWHFLWVLQSRLSLLWTPQAINVFFLLLTEFTSHNACQIQQFSSPQLFLKNL